MNAKQLQLEDGTKVDAFQCSECKQVYAERTAYSSESCCVCQDCGKTITKDERGGGRSTICRACWGPHYAAIDAARLAKAVEVTDYAGPVYAGDTFHRDLDDFKDSYEDDGSELPEFVHTCHVHHYSINGDDVLTNMLENAGVDEETMTVDELAGVPEFLAAVNAFNDANNKNEYWDIDYGHKVRVKPAAVPA